ncbi:MAG: PQQ-binding-like beta-propeller repeat protein [Eubacterium sp.]|jgi:hypothetical protein|nr:PQQ-binding-like beta-propeller repeat protein [Eubacterium sp.]
MKKICSFLIAAAILVLLPFQPLQAWSSFRNENGQGQANTIAAQTPVSSHTAGTKWQVRFVENETTTYNSDPVITDTSLYVTCKNTLYQLDKNGAILSSLVLAAPMNSVCRMCLDGNRLFIPLSGGRMQCVDISTMTSLWTSEAFGLQSLTTVYEKDGLIYAGTTNASGTEGIFYCLSAEDGSTQWTYTDAKEPCGYYWSGAVSDRAASFVLFGGDNGILVSHSAKDDAVLDTYDLSSCTSQADDPSAEPGKIRAGVTYDTETDAYYTTSTNGYLYRIKMTSQGTFESITAVSLFPSRTPDSNCTSTPTIVNGRIYVCSYSGFQGQVHVIDAVTMNRIYSASSPDCRDIKSSPLVCTGYTGCTDDETGNGSVYVYFTQNALPGGIYFIRDDMTAQSAEIETLFAPKEGKQFCLSSIAADSDGTLYYSNDSGTLFAIQDGYHPAPSEPSPTPDVSADATPTVIPPADPVLPKTGGPSNQEKPEQGNVLAKSKKPGKPRTVKWKIKKTKRRSYRVTFTWKKGAHSAYTQIKISKRNQKTLKKQWSQVYRASAAKKTITLKSGTYRVSFYGCQSGTKKSGAINRTLHLPSFD